MKTDSLNSPFAENMRDMHNIVQGAIADGLKSRMRLRSRGLPTPGLEQRCRKRTLRRAGTWQIDAAVLNNGTLK